MSQAMAPAVRRRWEKADQLANGVTSRPWNREAPTSCGGRPRRDRRGRWAAVEQVHIERPEAALDAVRSMPQSIVYGGEDVEPGRGSLYAYVGSADIPAIEAWGDPPPWS
jgi:hypothetical protein